ncbi:MAG TPA: hypothetical protein VHC70_14775 [Phycisphaerales bacterium]|jgi:hypothetical protein|nr:hypothetical protein [Phycisphaerales bacterium]
MVRKLAIGLFCIASLGLAACSETTSRADAGFSPDEPVWYNGNGERVHRSEMKQNLSDEWRSTPAANDGAMKRGM